MAGPCFLLDEHIPRAVLRGLNRREPDIQVFMIGQLNALPKQTSDQELLIWIEVHGCLLVTNNRATMPEHLYEHVAKGRHVPGILIVPRRFSIGDLIDELLLIWGVSLPDEFQDQIIYLPLTR